MTKKIDRIKQWTSEKLGQEQKTQESEEFRELEFEINMRYEGTERLHQSMSIYVRNLAKRRELDELEKASPIDILGQAMAIYGDEFVQESNYGQALVRLGAANQKLAKTQEVFVDRIQRNFLEGIEKSIAQFKDFQNARKKLEYRRLAYDAALSKVQKLKREDSRLEEEVRAQRIKYEEAGEDVVRKMNAIRDAESDQLSDVCDFFEAQCDYYERCNDVMQNLRKNWISEYIGSEGRTHKIEFAPQLLSSSISSGKFSAVINPPKFNRSVTEPPPLPGPRPSLGSKKKMVKANFKYEAETEDELTLNPGDVVIVTEEIDPGWWIGELASSGQSGLFPAPYCTVISEGNGASANGAPPKPLKSASVSGSSMRRASQFSADSHDEEDAIDRERPAAVSAPSYQSSMKKLSGGGGIVGSGRLNAAPGAKKPPPPPPKRTGVIGAIGAR
ncbi:hypothetical protein BZA70DRAFT_236611 [Myxozyma melibiosi]|uniref:BAR-domain-containing protein n=1 Tax=Myxozyma melibiosi TaxID=54550 RepID=A0ABR1F8N1_9ASCO